MYYLLKNMIHLLIKNFLIKLYHNILYHLIRKIPIIFNFPEYNSLLSIENNIITFTLYLLYFYPSQMPS